MTHYILGKKRCQRCRAITRRQFQDVAELLAWRKASYTCWNCWMAAARSERMQRVAQWYHNCRCATDDER